MGGGRRPFGRRSICRAATCKGRWKRVLFVQCTRLWCMHIAYISIVNYNPTTTKIYEIRTSGCNNIARSCARTTIHLHIINMSLPYTCRVHLSTRIIIIFWYKYVYEIYGINVLYFVSFARRYRYPLDFDLGTCQDYQRGIFTWNKRFSIVMSAYIFCCVYYIISHGPWAPAWSFRTMKSNIT